MGDIDWEVLYAEGAVPSPIDRDLIRVAADLEPGAAMDLGCGLGQNSLWLAERGWTVSGVDISPTAIRQANEAAALAGLEATFEVADLGSWTSATSFDLVVSTYALPPLGPGRVHALEEAARIVAPGGTVLLAEFDETLAADNWWKREDLVALEELTAPFVSFEVLEATVTTKAHAHGHDEEHYPVALFIGRRALRPLIF